jgi:predicted glycosyltransferase
MKIWFDADNAPHVLVMKPLAAMLERSGHKVVFTARDRSSTRALLDLHGLDYVLVGGGSRRGMAGKVSSTLRRAVELARIGRRIGADVSFGHGSRALPIASALAGVPSVTMYDYEWVDPTVFNIFCRSILLPAVIGPDRAAEAGISKRRMQFFDGYKEELYLSGWAPDPSVQEILGPGDGMIRILVRPPSVTAHYHVAESQEIYRELLDLLCARSDVQIVLIPREDPDIPVPRPGGAAILVPGRAVDGPSLIWEMDLVAGGGGTMTREAAVLGVPAVSFFRGRQGRVDERLASEGRLALLEPGGARLLRIGRRRSEPSAPERGRLVSEVCDRILAAARPG